MRSDSRSARKTLIGLSLLAMAVIAPWVSCLPLGSTIGFGSRERAELLAKLEHQPEAREWIQNNGLRGTARIQQI